MAKKSGIAMVVMSLVLGAGAGAAAGGCGDDDRGSVDVEGGTTGTGTVGTTTTPDDHHDARDHRHRHERLERLRLLGRRQLLLQRQHRRKQIAFASRRARARRSTRRRAPRGRPALPIRVASTRSAAPCLAASRRTPSTWWRSFWPQSTSTLPSRSDFAWRETTNSGMPCSIVSATALANGFVSSNVTSVFSGAYTCRPLPPDVLTNVSRPSWDSMPRRASATWQHVAMSAGGPGSRSNTRVVGRSGASTAARCGMQLDRRLVRELEQRRQVVDPVVALPPLLALDAVRVPLHADEPAVEVGEDHLADPLVVRDQLALGEAGRGEQHLVHVRALDLPLRLRRRRLLRRSRTTCSAGLSSRRPL